MILFHSSYLAASFYATQSVDKFLNIKKSERWYEKYFNNLADSIRLVSLFFVFTSVYKNKIKPVHGLILGIVLIGANIRYTSVVSIEKREGVELDHGVELWTKLFDGISDTNMEKIKKISYPFKERLVAAYILILIAVIHFS